MIRSAATSRPGPDAPEQCCAKRTSTGSKAGTFEGRYRRVGRLTLIEFERVFKSKVTRPAAGVIQPMSTRPTGTPYKEGSLHQKA